MIISEILSENDFEKFNEKQGEKYLLIFLGDLQNLKEYRIFALSSWESLQKSVRVVLECYGRKIKEPVIKVDLRTPFADLKQNKRLEGYYVLDGDKLRILDEKEVSDLTDKYYHGKS